MRSSLAFLSLLFVGIAGISACSETGRAPDVGQVEQAAYYVCPPGLQQPMTILCQGYHPWSKDVIVGGNNRCAGEACFGNSNPDYQDFYFLEDFRLVGEYKWPEWSEPRVHVKLRFPNRNDLDIGKFPSFVEAWPAEGLKIVTRATTGPNKEFCDVKEEGGKTIMRLRPWPEINPLPRCQAKLTDGKFLYSEHWASNPVYGCIAWGECIEPDRDGDAFADGEDNCPDVANAVADEDDNQYQIDTDGDGIGDACDPDQLCPCAGSWANHGQYVSCVASTSDAIVAAGLISAAQQDVIVSAAAKSACGESAKGSGVSTPRHGQAG